MSPAKPADDPTGSGMVTALLAAWSAGEEAAAERLLPIVYGELKAIARKAFRRERGDHTLQPTAVVHEAFIKLAGGGQVSFRGRAHFFAVAAQAMRHVLVDHARARAAAKRGSGVTLLELGEEAVAGGPGAVDVLAVDAALSRLAALDADQARIVELRFFGGLTVEETAEVVGTSRATVNRDWRLARAFLSRELASSGQPARR
jgi:RNA polymerase sigma-70 factor, ECF subfamily